MPGNRRALLYQLQDSPRPTLIVLHPYSGDALSTARYSGFLQAAISTLEVDYLAYGRKHLERFMKADGAAD